MKKIFHNFPKNIASIFCGKNLLWHLAAIFLTFAIVVLGLDWNFFLFARESGLQMIFFPAIIIGGLLPLILPIFLWILARIRRSDAMNVTAFMLVQTEALAWSVSAVYKVFTGRIPPLHDFNHSVQTAVDISHNFQFGFMRGGIFWGWPSSHTTVAFAMALAICEFFPRNKILRLVAMVYAFYVAFGVAFTGIHWLSEAVAGAIIGAVIGKVVGKSFSEKQNQEF